MASTMSIGAAVCVVTLCLFLQVGAQRPMLAPTGAPMYAPEMAPPMYAPEMAPVPAAELAPEPAPEMSPTPAPLSSVMAPGPSPAQSGAARNVASSAGVLVVGLTAFFLF